jgi:hypothetical protein
MKTATLFVLALFGFTIPPALAQDIRITVAISQKIDGRQTRGKGVLDLANFPKHVSNSFSMPATISVGGKILCSGRVRTEGYKAYFSTKCKGKTFRGNASINRTIRIGNRTINFIRKARLKSGGDFIEITTGRVAGTTGKKLGANRDVKKKAARTPNRTCYRCDSMSEGVLKKCMTAVEYDQYASDGYVTCKKL